MIHHQRQDTPPPAKPSALETLCETLNQLIKPPPPAIDWAIHRYALWTRQPYWKGFTPLTLHKSPTLTGLIGLDEHIETLRVNTRQLLTGLPANNALLWGARGTGKSSLIRGVLAEFTDPALRVIEVIPEHLIDLPDIVSTVAAHDGLKFVLFCDDFSFDEGDASFRTTKRGIQGTLLGLPSNIVIYATSNRRHMIAEAAADNMDHTSTELHRQDLIEEKLSLSDRFGLWLSFYPPEQQTYLLMCQNWVRYYSMNLDVRINWTEDARTTAIQWALQRGQRSGRAANQFARYWVGRKVIKPTGQ